MSDLSRILRAKVDDVQNAISTKEREIESLRAKLEVLTELLSEHESRVEPEQPVVHPRSESQSNGQLFLGGRYTNMRLTNAVRDAIRQFPTGASVPEVRDFLLKNGFRPRGENFHNSVATALIRMVGKGLTKSDGPRPIYRVISVGHPTA
jgi:hypothetical protein